MNWNKIAANFGVVFFGTLASVTMLGLNNATGVAVLNAIILGGLAACKEWLEESERIEPGKLNGMVLF